MRFLLLFEFGRPLLELGFALPLLVCVALEPLSLLGLAVLLRLGLGLRHGLFSVALGLQRIGVLVGLGRLLALLAGLFALLLLLLLLLFGLLLFLDQPFLGLEGGLLPVGVQQAVLEHLRREHLEHATALLHALLLQVLAVVVAQLV